jgi:predicted  nucleic acid-binding Zn-ribbon protein
MGEQLEESGAAGLGRAACGRTRGRRLSRVGQQSPLGEQRLGSAGTRGDRRKERPIKADKEAQLRLLDLQLLDTALAQLDHRRKTVPELAQIAQLRVERAGIAANLVAADTAVSDLEAEQSTAEADLEPVRDRLIRNEHRIADGSIADPKALASMIEEVDHLRKRISNLEDAELEIMEQLEAAEAERRQLRVQAAEVDEQLTTLAAKRDQQLSELEAEIAERNRERAEIAPLIPDNLAALYLKIRSGHGGVGAAELRQRRCTGCQLEINAAELRAFSAAPEDEVLRCEECGRILIRTENSGL